MSGRQSRQWRVERETGARRSEVGFSLVEVTVAIGIFAFVVVGVLGLLPTALKLRAESAQETRAVLIAQELFDAVHTAPSVTNMIFRDGPGLTANNNRTNINLLNREVVLGYPTQTTVPFWSFDRNPGNSWTNANGADTEIRESAVNDIQTLARLKAYAEGSGLYRITCEVRSPASIPLANSKPALFQTYIYSP